MTYTSYVLVISTTHTQTDDAWYLVFFGRNRKHLSSTHNQHVNTNRCGNIALCVAYVPKVPSLLLALLLSHVDRPCIYVKHQEIIISFPFPSTEFCCVIRFQLITSAKRKKIKKRTHIWILNSGNWKSAQIQQFAWTILFYDVEFIRTISLLQFTN